MRTGFLFWGDKNILEVEGGDGRTKLQIYLTSLSRVHLFVRRPAMFHWDTPPVTGGPAPAKGVGRGEY